MAPVITGLYQHPYSTYNTQQLVSMESMGMMAEERDNGRLMKGYTTTLLYGEIIVSFKFFFFLCF